MNNCIIRGRTLTFNKAPNFTNDRDSYTYDEHGALLIINGLIEKRGSFSEIKNNSPKNLTIHDHKNNLILPGFIDPHIHFPQMQVIGSYASNLIEWLNTYTFIEEQKYNNYNHCAIMAKKFINELIKHGTTTASSFCTIHKESVEAFFTESKNRNMLMIAGKVMMDRNAPKKLLDTPKSGYDDTKELINKWHSNSRQYYAISPRFAITSTSEQLEITKTLLQEHPECYLQTHLSENLEEIYLAKKLFPNCKDYASIYEKYNLLGSKSLFGHCVHLSDREIKILNETKSIAIFCPTSNLFLGSGLFNFNKIMQEYFVRTAIATDIGGGTNYSMLKTMDEAYKILQLQNQRLTPLYSFYQMTLGNACALSLENKIGNLEVSTDADITVLNSRATSAMKIRMETVQNLEEELFVLQTLGDDRSVEEVYIQGAPSKKYLKN